MTQNLNSNLRLIHEQLTWAVASWRNFADSAQPKAGKARDCAEVVSTLFDIVKTPLTHTDPEVCAKIYPKLEELARAADQILKGDKRATLSELGIQIVKPNAKVNDLNELEKMLEIVESRMVH